MPLSFGLLLRRLRVAQNLSQDALAELAHVSAAAIGAYERGVRSAPHRSTVALLADALRLSGASRTEFESSAQRKPRARTIPEDGEAEIEPLGNLRLQTTSFMGRETEIDEIADALRRHRLVTVTGPGGVGKTRIALQVASRFLPPQPDGAWFVDLGAIDDAGRVCHTIAATLNVPLADDHEASTMLAKQLKSRRMLIILDNCEHLLGSVGIAVSAILGSCPSVMILTTSRERLRISSELVYRLTTLPVPESDPGSLAEALRFPSVEMFVERCRSAERNFNISNDNVSLIVQICRALEGIPLAIELTAAQLPTLGLPALRDRILGFLNGQALGMRDLPLRQQTLRSTVEWSYSLLDNREAALLRRLSVFRGGCTLSATESVCTDEPVDVSSTAPLLSSLVDKSLLMINLTYDEPRYSLLESTRAYAAEKLEEEHEGSNLARRHAEWCATFALNADRMRPQLSTRDWHARVDPDVININRGIEWSMSSGGDVVIAGNIVGALRSLWIMSKRVWMMSKRVQHLSELTQAILERLDEESHPVVCARLYLALASTLHPNKRADLLTKALALYQRNDDRLGLLSAYMNLAACYDACDRKAELSDTLDAAWELAHALKATKWYSDIFTFRASRDYTDGRYALAKEALLHALSFADESDASSEWVVMSLAELEFKLGDFTSAAERVERLAHALRSERDSGPALTALVVAQGYRLALGQIDLAEEHARSVLLGSAGRARFLTKTALLTIAATAAARKHSRRAARLFGFATDFNTDDLYLKSDTYEATLQTLTRSLSEQLTEDEIRLYREQGSTLTEQLAIAEALGKPDARPSMAGTEGDAGLSAQR